MWLEFLSTFKSVTSFSVFLPAGPDNCLNNSNFERKYVKLPTRNMLQAIGNACSWILAPAAEEGFFGCRQVCVGVRFSLLTEAGLVSTSRVTDLSSPAMGHLAQQIYHHRSPSVGPVLWKVAERLAAVVNWLETLRFRSVQSAVLMWVVCGGRLKKWAKGCSNLRVASLRVRAHTHRCCLKQVTPTKERSNVRWFLSILFAYLFKVKWWTNEKFMSARMIATAKFFSSSEMCGSH